MRRPTILEQIRALDPVADHQRIVFLSSCYDFPFDTTRALEFALFRTFCVPSVSALLDRTGEFHARAQKRYDDTDLIVSALMEWGYDSERGRAALRRMNQIHGRFQIDNADFLYVLSTFVFEPIRWNARFGWRPMCTQERLAMFHFWRAVGVRMNIQQLPEAYEEYERYNIDYERAHFRYTPANHRVGAATREMFVSWFPRPTHRLVRAVIHTLLDDHLLDAFGFPRANAGLRRLVFAAMAQRARLLRWLPARRRPRLRTEMKHRTYPNGYRIEQLGPPEGPATAHPLSTPPQTEPAGRAE